MKYAALLLTTLVACAHATKSDDKPIATLPPPEPPAVLPTPAPEPVARVPASCASDDRCAANELCLEGTCTAITASLAACGLTRVHFAFDAATLDPPEFPVLQRAARCIAANRPTHVLIAGNADERGSAQYNVALGYRRAAAVQHYLVDLGVSQGRLDLVSYGKEMPLCQEHDEDCWRLNRRAGIRPNETARRN